MTAATRIGIVLIGRNEGERLRRCLQSIPAGLPVVYVDSASTDGSAELAAETGAQVVHLDLSRPFTAARARNAGFAALLTSCPGVERVQFVDGDCEIEPGWLEAAMVYLDAHADVAVVCGRRRERFPSASLYNRLCDREWDTPVGEAEACGGDALMRVAAFEAAGGFDDAIVAGEEPELCSRVRASGAKIWRIDAPMTIHDAAMLGFGQWWKRAVRGGFGYAQTWSLRRLYGRELARALLWAGMLPALALGLAIAVSPAFLALLLLPFAQIVRIALRDGPSDHRWRRAALLMLGKAAELQGALHYALFARSPASYK